MARETFWIYLFVVSLLNWKKIFSDRTYVFAFVLLWAVPVLWLLMIPFGHWWVDGRFPDFPTQWPLGINKTDNQAVTDLSTTLSSLWWSLTRTKVIYFAVSVVVLWGALKASWFIKDKPNSPVDDFASSFIPFSLVSLGIIYALFILFDPFQATYGDGRMSAPLLIHSLVWSIVLFSQASAGQWAMKSLAMVVIVLGISPSIVLDRWEWKPNDYSEIKLVHQEMEEDLKRLAPDRQAPICINDDGYFEALRRLVTPTLYRNRIMVLQDRNASLQRCDVVSAPTDSEFLPGDGFTELKEYVIDNFSYTLFLRQTEPGLYNLISSALYASPKKTLMRGFKELTT